MQHTVTVWDRPYEVSVHQKSKTVWIAVGNYEGARVETQGRTESQALASWREAARYRGN
jgi:hypothetical protein